MQTLESSTGSVTAGVQKLARAAKLLDDKEVLMWCEIQFGTHEYTIPLETLLTKFLAHRKKADDDTAKAIKESWDAIAKLGLKLGKHYSNEEFNVKADPAGGGYSDIGFLEGCYRSVQKSGKPFYGNLRAGSLQRHLSYVRKAAHDKATELYNRFAFADAPITAFDILKSVIDDRLMDLNAELAEQLMVAFKSVSRSTPEDWSHALTSCRRLIDGLADALYPPREDTVNGRRLGKVNSINRLWAFMDQAIESESNKELAKCHVDFLGSCFQRLHKISSKGVHAGLERIEAVKAVFHTYLLIADLLDYVKGPRNQDRSKQNIHSASLDQIESVLGTRRSIAKEIIKLRVEHAVLDGRLLATIKGIGPKTLARAKERFSFEPVD